MSEDALATSVQAPKSPSKLSEKQTPELTAHIYVILHDRGCRNFFQVFPPPDRVLLIQLH